MDLTVVSRQKTDTKPVFLNGGGIIPAVCHLDSLEGEGARERSKEVDIGGARDSERGMPCLR